MKRHGLIRLSAVVLLGSIVFYVALPTSQGLLIISVPQTENYCLDWRPIPRDVQRPEQNAGQSEYCASFINTYERVAYYHNLGMVQRNAALLKWIHGLTIVLPIVVAVIVVRLRGRETPGESEWVHVAAISGVAVIIGGHILIKALPSPAVWAPAFVQEAIDARRLAILGELSERSRQIDSGVESD